MCYYFMQYIDQNHMQTHYRAKTFDHLTAVSGVGSSPTRGTCETSQQVQLAVVLGFSRGSPVFAVPTD